MLLYTNVRTYRYVLIILIVLKITNSAWQLQTTNYTLMISPIAVLIKILRNNFKNGRDFKIIVSLSAYFLIVEGL